MLHLAPEIAQDGRFAAVALAPVTAISAWIAWADLSRLRIPNAASALLLLIYFAVGAAGQPPVSMTASTLIAGALLIFGFVLSQTGRVGAGDAKLLAIAALYIAPADWPFLTVLIACFSLAALAALRIVAAIPVLAVTARGWESWDHKRFPFGLPLSAALVSYLAVGALNGG